MKAEIMERFIVSSSDFDLNPECHQYIAKKKKIETKKKKIRTGLAVPILLDGMSSEK